MSNMTTQLKMVELETGNGCMNSCTVCREDMAAEYIEDALCSGARYSSAKITYNGITAECDSDEIYAKVHELMNAYPQKYAGPLRAWAEIRTQQMMTEVGL